MDATYHRTIHEIYALQEFAIKLGLENITALCQILGQPHKRYPVIHLAGTNGKGSTAFFLAAFLQAHGLKAGLFTSPHLRDYRERIRVNDQWIEPEFVVQFWQSHKNDILRRKATFFDTTTAMGFAYFARKEVDVAVIETGLGGRLDSTNIVQPREVVLTPIDFDHQKQLGNTLSSIAREKAGIIKKGAPIFCAPQPEEALQVFLRAAAGNPFHYLPHAAEISLHKESLDEMTFEVVFRENHEKHVFVSKQVGDFQAWNMTLAMLAARHFLQQQGIAWNQKKVAEVLQSKIWPARLQTIRREPRIIFDVSHNLQGIRRTLRFVQRVAPEKQIILLLGLIETKDYGAIVSYLKEKNLNIWVTEPNISKKLPATVLENEFRRQGVAARCVENPRIALQQIAEKQKSSELLIVLGSHYLIGDLLNDASLMRALKK